MQLTPLKSSTVDAKQAARQRAVLSWLGAALLMLALVGWWRWQSERSSSALRSLPEPERKALYVGAMQTLRGVCASEHRVALADYCGQQAELVVQLPECDGACQDFVRTQYPRATR